MTLHIDTETYREYKDRMMELANQVTRIEDSEYVVELRTNEEIAAEIEELTPEEVADIRTITEVKDAPMDYFHASDEKLQ